jgi:histidinol dehydrogenase
MEIINQPERKDWKKILQRPFTDNSEVLETVRTILNEVKEKGDEAVRDFVKKFDGVELKELPVSGEELEKAGDLLPEKLKQAISHAASNIKKFHSAQVGEIKMIETGPGIKCWRKQVAIEKVGLYIPGGSAPLFSTVLMLGIPAAIAGCREIVMCTPPGKNGEVHPAVLFAAKTVGISRIFKLGGAQAIAAMAFGTETIPAVSKIFGPGNRYVTAAKQLVQLDGVAIDMPAGPSEVCIVADASADAGFVAADLLSQAEHGADSQVLLITDDPSLVLEVNMQIEKQLEKLPRKKIAERSLRNSRAIVVSNVNEAIEMANEYAPEHLIICTKETDVLATKVMNAGSVFIGNYSPESAGDYASGTNHTLPTNGFAKAYSGVSVDSFVRSISFQEITKPGLDNIAGTVIAMAEAEGLQAHAEAIRIRMKDH